MKLINDSPLETRIKNTLKKQRSKFFIKLNGLFEKILAIINIIIAKDAYEKRSLYITIRLTIDGERKITIKALITLYFLSKTSNIFTNRMNKKVLNNENIIIAIYKDKLVIS